MKHFKSKLTGRTIPLEDQCFYCKEIQECVLAMAVHPRYKCKDFNEDPERRVAGSETDQKSMDWKESITQLCNTTINEVDIVVGQINKSKHEKPVLVLKMFSDGKYSCYIEDEEGREYV